MWKQVSFVLRAKNRKKVIKALDRPKLPSQLATELEIQISHVSRTLSELEEAGLIECLTPDEKIGKLYRLTKKGREVLEQIA
jgi:DNA-binding MarR family transcriptional regulator